MLFSCATCMSTLGFCIIIFLFSGSFPSTKTILNYNAYTKHFPVLLCTTKLAQNPSQYYLYYKACTKHFPILLCTTKLAQNTFQYYCVLQSLHKAHFSTTLYYKICTKHFPVLLYTTNLAQNTSQYYFVLQNLHKVLPSTTLYYKVCTNYFPALLCTTKARSNTTLYYKVCTKHFPKTRDETRENQRLETRHVGAAKRAFRTRRPPILTLSTRYQTGWNLTKCHACHAKQHNNLLRNLRKGEGFTVSP